MHRELTITLKSFFRVKGINTFSSSYDQAEVLPFENCRRDENFSLMDRKDDDHCSMEWSWDGEWL